MSLVLPWLARDRIPKGLDRIALWLGWAFAGPRRTRPAGVTAWSLAMAAVLASAASAQVVRGVVVDEASGRPIPGAVVVLLDSSGSRLATVLAGDDGRYAVRTTLPGRYGIRAERIGFRATSPMLVTLEASEAVELRLVTSPIPVILSTVRVTGRTPCVARASDGRDISAVWEEARKALYATDITQRQELFSARVARYVRMLDARTRRVTSHETTQASGVTRNPFVSLAAAQLSADGYVRVDGGETIYYGPDAAVLLSDEFLGDHCFRLRAGDGSRSGLIGLEFEPTRGRDKPDIAGVLWIDRQSAELRYLEYTYRNLPNLPRSVNSDEFGGRIEFLRMPTGAWIVQRWVIRMPMLVDRGRFADQPTAIPGVSSGREDRVQIGAIREEGGEVLETTAYGARRELASEGAAVRGVVFDSTRMAPLAGARVFLDGTQFATQSAATGEFALSNVPAGSYTISVVHARFDSLGVKAPAEGIALRPGEPATVRLAGPSNATLIARDCAADGHTAGMAVVRGFVREHATLAPVADAAVTATWNQLATAGQRPIGTTEQRRGTRTDAEGRYVLCALPDGTRLGLSAAYENRRSLPISTLLPGDAISVLDIAIGGPVVVASAEPTETSAPSARRQASPTAVNRAMQAAERRRRGGGGSYVTRAQIDRRRASRLSDLLRTLPGVAVRQDETGELVVELRGSTRMTLETPAPVPGATDSSSAPVPNRTLAARQCPAAFQVDGIPFDRIKIDGDIQPDEIELIEVYPGAVVPIEYAGRSSGCGLVLIWTRAFAERSEPTAGDGTR